MAQVKTLKNNKWIEKQIVRPYLAFDGILCEALQHTLPQIIPPSHHEEAEYPFPAVVFRLFDFTDVPEVGFLLNIQLAIFWRGCMVPDSLCCLFYILAYSMLI